MRRDWVAWRRRLLIFALALPLLQTGTCVEIVQRSLINGFFDAATNVLNDHATQTIDTALSP